MTDFTKRLAAVWLSVFIILCSASVCVHAEDGVLLGTTSPAAQFTPSAEVHWDIQVVEGSASVTMYENRAPADADVKDTLDAAMSELTEHHDEVMSSVKEAWYAKTGNAPFSNASAIALFDLSGTAGKITLTFDSINAQDIALILHRQDGVWKNEEFTVNEDNSVTICPESLSPFAVIANNKMMSEQAEERTSPTAATTQTGDTLNRNIATAVVIAGVGVVMLIVYFSIWKNNNHRKGA